ncbi:hypothetical protein MJ579_16345 [Klebsiella pneumoniae]|nr:hypothetical protein MJ579_16345 [Klebsiella pneumoniae]
MAIGTSIWLPAILFGHGLLLALTPVVAQLGSGESVSRRRAAFRASGWPAFCLGADHGVARTPDTSSSSMHNIDPLLAEGGWLPARCCGALGLSVLQVARNQCEGLAKTKPGMVIGFIGLLVNIR